MLFDRTTEAIAHFIGAFHLGVEAARLRDTYDMFRIKPPEPEARVDLLSVPVVIDAPHSLKGFDPGVDHIPPPMLVDDPITITVTFGPGLSAPPPEWEGSDNGPVSISTAIASQGGQMFTWISPLPAQMATLTLQDLFLSDDDVLTFGGGTVFVDPGVFLAALRGLADLAEGASLNLLDHLGHDAVPDPAQAVAFAKSLAELPDGPAPSGTLLRLLPEDAGRIVVDGALAETIPDFIALLPAPLHAKVAPEEAEDPSLDPPPLDDPYALPPGHSLTTGSNLATNEVFVTTNGLDAGVIAVAGDVVRIDAISQVNMVVTTPGALPSQAINAASITPSLLPIASLAETVLPQTGAPVFPVTWSLNRVEGDVIFANRVEQHVFATDNDRVEAVFAASASQIVMGDNILSNLTGILGLGTHYDLVIVGGSMITLNVVEQINVLLDVDTVTGFPAETVSSGGNLLMNRAEVNHTTRDTLATLKDSFRDEMQSLADGAKSLSASLAREAEFAGKSVINALYIAGDLIEANIIRQTSYLGDSDQIAMIRQSVIEDLQAAGLTVSTGQNAMLNAARITDQGMDSTLMAGGAVYSDALIHQAGFLDEAAPPTGVQLSGLAAEAVAFLAPGMIDPVPADQGHDAGAVADWLPAQPASLDVLQTVLA